MLVQALVPKCPVETLNECILSRFARRYEAQFHAVLLAPGDDGPAAEFWTVVDDEFTWRASQIVQLLQNLNNTRSSDRTIDLELRALSAPLIEHRQDPKRSTIQEGIVHKVHAPTVVSSLDGPANPYRCHVAFPPVSTFTDLQAFLPVNALDALVIVPEALASKHQRQHGRTPAAVLVGQVPKSATKTAVVLRLRSIS